MNNLKDLLREAYKQGLFDGVSLHARDKMPSSADELSSFLDQWAEGVIKRGKVGDVDIEDWISVDDESKWAGRNC